MSLMDVLFSMPMAEIIEQMPVGDDVAAALLRREGFYGNLLKLAESIEQMGDESEEDDVTPVLRELQVSSSEMAEIEMDAFAWSDTVVKYGVDIGKVVQPIAQGQHAHVHNIKTKRW